MANSFLDKTGLGLVWAQIKLLLAGKVDKVDGKGLSSNDYTADEKAKLANIQAGAEVNVNADWNAVTGDAAILNKPTIPTATSDLTNDSGFITAQDVPEAVTVDDELDFESTNPVENQAVTSAISNVSQFFTGLSEYVTSSQLTSFENLFSCDFIHYYDGDNNVNTYLFAQGWRDQDHPRRFKSFDGMVQIYYHPRDYYWYVTLDGGNSRVMIDPSTNEDEYCQKITAYKWNFVTDWNYIQNRTHFKNVYYTTEIFPQQTVTVVSTSSGGTITNIANVPTAGDVVIVKIDGLEYDCVATASGDNIVLSNSDFYISIPQTGDGVLRVMSGGNYNVAAYMENAYYYKLSNQYLNIDDTLKSNSSNLVSNSVITNAINQVSNSIPTNNNQLTNGAGYQTASDVNSLIATAVGDLEGVDFEIVQTLPATGDKAKIYLVPLETSGTDNIYDEYIWITSSSTYEKIGTTDVDLSDYYNTTNLVPITNAEINTICQ